MGFYKINIEELMDFPRVPFTTDYELFMKIGRLGKKLVDLHLMKSRVEESCGKISREWRQYCGKTSV